MISFKRECRQAKYIMMELLTPKYNTQTLLLYLSIPALTVSQSSSTIRYWLPPMWMLLEQHRS